jgi:hypothetical protein
MTEQAWFLEDAEARSRAHPDTFHIPALVRRYNLHVGCFVKLFFLFTEPGKSRITDEARELLESFDEYPGRPPDGERMWVRVDEVLSAGRYRGTLSNDPVVMDEYLQDGDTIFFEAKHVADIDDSDLG